MGSPGCDEDEIALSYQQLDLVDRSVLDEPMHVSQKRCYTIADPGLVANAPITVEVLLHVIFFASDVNGFVILPDKRLALLGGLRWVWLGWATCLGVTTLIRRSAASREGPVLNDDALFESEDLEEQILPDRCFVPCATT